jgi:hypothetical protein
MPVAAAATAAVVRTFFGEAAMLRMKETDTRRTSLRKQGGRGAP